MKKRKSRRKKGSLILTKVAISGADVIEHERETKSLSFCISRRLPLILISSSSFLLFFFSFMKSAISASREILCLSLSLFSLSLSLFCLSLLLSSASLPPPLPINLFFSLRSSGPRNEQRKSIGWHCGFVPTPAVLRSSSSTLVSASVDSVVTRRWRNAEFSSDTLFFPFFFSFLEREAKWSRIYR